ncbi:MAG: hypothetical protein HY253_10500 [Burkholderiales bacterium]|nr:hypothetical protein [Burkholderiales bacterium]
MTSPPKKAQSARKNKIVVKHGALPPSVQVQHFSAAQWEEFIEAACVSRLMGSKNYAQVKRLGNAGDAGRDVEARLVHVLLEGQWDLYQAKHYNHRLTPSDVFGELVKFFGHVEAKTYPRPRYYYVCSPQNAGPDLHDLIAAPDKFKQRFLSDWQSGATGLKGKSHLLTPAMNALVDEFDFADIKECLLRDLLQWHEVNTSAHYELFGLENERGDDPTMPAMPTTNEQHFIEELVGVYAEDSKTNMSLSDVVSSKIYSEHFSACRSEFYCAEGLKRFSRDIYPDDEFGHLLTMVLSGIRSTVAHPKHKTGLDRLTAAIELASGLTITDSKLHSRLRGGDLPGTCHHLVNEQRVKWIK